jgi:2,5-dihydroxypyridine 5,6-dioxygenase
VNPAKVADLVPLFQEELVRCALRAGEKVLVWADTDYPYPEYGPAFFSAAYNLGADVAQMVTPAAVSKRFIDSPQCAAAWKAADLVVVLTSFPNEYLYSRTNNDALAAGARTLCVLLAPDILRKMVPRDDYNAKADAGVELLNRSAVVRVKSAGGTDLVVRRGKETAHTVNGICAKPGSWTHWGQGAKVSFYISRGNADGKFVVDPGDVNFAFKRHVTEPVELTIERGRITRIDGGFEARMLQDWFAAFHHDAVYDCAHLGWGCDPRPDWHRVEQNLESYYGNVLLAFGRSVLYTTEGRSDAPAHVDLICRSQDFYADDTLVVKQGRIVPPELDTLA